MSLVASHTVLFWHRKVAYGPPVLVPKAQHSGGVILEAMGENGNPRPLSTTAETEDELTMTQPTQGSLPMGSPKSSPSSQPSVVLATEAGVSKAFVLLLLVVAVTLHAIGCALEVFEISNEKAGEIRYVRYSLIRLGDKFPQSASDPNNVAIRWLQAMFMFLGIALPFLNAALFAVLYLFPFKSAVWMERLFMAAEICFAWSSIEVLFVSLIFSVGQISEFSTGLLDAGCDQCFVVGSKFLGSSFAVLCVATVISVASNVWLYNKAHHVLYPPERRLL